MPAPSDRKFDAKAIVSQGYDQCAQKYAAQRDVTAPHWLSLFTRRLPMGGAVLDIGCGCGLPITSALAAEFEMTGVDISATQIALARQNVYSASFVHGDIMNQVFEPGNFDGVVMVYALFHLPRCEHAELLGRVREWLRPGGLLLATLATTSHAGYVEHDFFGADMYWSHFSKNEYDPVLNEAGFDLLHTCEIGDGYRTASSSQLYQRR